MVAKNELLYIPSGYEPIKGLILTADATNLITIATVPAADANVLWLSATSDDTLANDLLFYLNDGTADYLVGHVDIPIEAGFNGTTPAVNCLNGTTLPFLPYDDASNRYWPLDAGAVLKVGLKTTVSATRSVWIRGQMAVYTVLTNA